MKIKTRKNAFTLIELLVVIAIIGILAGIIFPSVSAVVNRANAAKTRTMFSQWIAAIEDFRSEYGFYPTFGGAAADDTAVRINDQRELFYHTLTGRLPSGPGTPSGAQNRRNIRFYSFSDESIADDETYGPASAGDIIDAFGNPDIYVVVDSNRDGVIRSFPSLPSGDMPSGNELNAGVAVYSVRNADFDFPTVTSWD